MNLFKQTAKTILMFFVLLTVLSWWAGLTWADDDDETDAAPAPAGQQQVDTVTHDEEDQDEDEEDEDEDDEFPISPPPPPGEQRIIMDGYFDDWIGRATMTDPGGDTPSAVRDIASFSWETNPGEANLYFMISRYAHNSSEVTFRLNLDINNDGVYADSVDRYAMVTYRPREHSGDVRVRLYNGRGHLISNDGGDWGDSDDSGESRFEFRLSMSDLEVYPAQALRLYLSSLDGKGHLADRCPDSGDIQWAPVPAAGMIGLVVMMLAGLLLITAARKKQTWSY